MVDFAGWEMPVQFKSIVEEHTATRTNAGLFDVSHMGEAIVEGPQAATFLNYALTNNVIRMDDGQALYSLMCYENGGVVDDLLVYRKGANSFLLCLNASNTEKDINWLSKQIKPYDAQIRDVSNDYGLIALQGPKAFGILDQIADVGLSELGYYRFAEGNVGNVQCLVSRTGYTGEPGVEIFAPWEQTMEVAEALLFAGKDKGLVLAGLGARDSLRLEAGYSLYGHEISEAITPVQAKLMWTVKVSKKGGFIGSEAISQELSVGPSKQIVFFKTGNRRIVRPGASVSSEGLVVGEVVSGTFSPSLNEGIGSALVQSEAAGGTSLSVDLRGKELPIEIVKPPFVALNPKA